MWIFSPVTTVTSGIGLDDTFIVISAWRNTPTSAPVEERVGLTMKYSAVSVTLTSLTNTLAFGIGMSAIFW